MNGTPGFAILKLLPAPKNARRASTLKPRRAPPAAAGEKDLVICRSPLIGNRKS